MKCLACGSEELLGNVTIDLFVSLAKKGGSLKIGGVKIGQNTVLDAWDGPKNKEKKIKGPIVCADCESRHYYVVGSKKSLRLGDHEEAQTALEAGTLEV